VGHGLRYDFVIVAHAGALVSQRQRWRRSGLGVDVNDKVIVDILANLLAFGMHSLPWVYIFAVTCMEIGRMVSFRKKNGAVIWRPGGRRLKALLPYLAPIAFMVFVITLSTGSHGLDLVLLVLLTIMFLPHVAWALRTAFFGIYESRIVGDQFVSEWREIEKIIPLEDRIRLVDKTRGAVDFLIDERVLPTVIQRVEKRWASASLDNGSQSETAWKHEHAGPKD